MLQDHVADEKGVRRSAQISSLIVPGLGRNLFSVKQAARNDVVSVFNMNDPRLEILKHTFPLQELGQDLYYYFSLGLAGGSNGPDWQCRLRQSPTCGIGDWDTSTASALAFLKTLNTTG